MTKIEPKLGHIVWHNQLGIGKVIGEHQENLDQVWVTFLFYSPNALMAKENLSVLDAYKVRQIFGYMQVADCGQGEEAYTGISDLNSRDINMVIDGIKALGLFRS